MKKYLLLVLAVAVSGASNLSAQVLTQFSAAGINPFTAGDLEAPWVSGVNSTINSGTGGLTVTSVSNNSGGIADVLENTVPVTQTTNYLTLTGNLLAQPTVDHFEILVYDSSFSDVLAYDFKWSSFNHVGNWSYTGTLDAGDSSGTFNGTVGGFQLELGGTALDAAPNVSFQFDTLAFTSTFVPEPSTYAMFGFGLVLLYGVYRRKASQA